MANIKDKAERNFRLVSSSGETNTSSLNFNKIKVGDKVLRNDVTMDVEKAERLQAYLMGGHRKIKQEDVKKALVNHDIRFLRDLSRKWFERSGIYSRLCRYMAYLFKYDWFLTPIMNDNVINGKSSSQTSIIRTWCDASRYLEKSNLKRTFGDIALKVIRDGCYYGYKVVGNDATFIQELPVGYCRSRYALNGKPAIEFNIKFFDDAFSDASYRVRVLRMWPKEFQKAYLAYKEGTLPKDYSSDDYGWFLLDPSSAIKFNLTDDDAPLFIAVVPKLMDLEDAQDLDKKKMLQQIIKIIIQKLPIDKNGDLIFDVDEAQQLHSNAVQMLSNAIGVDVLTTFADVDVADMSDNSKTTTTDQLEKVERTVYNEAGTGQNLFNAEGNLSLEKSILNDEATMTPLILQFEDYAESLLTKFNKNPKRVYYKVQILPTTVYNYKDLAKSYKELASIGFSKLLPQVALGQSQSTVIMTAYFENKLLNLNDVFIPPASSATTAGGTEKTVSAQDNDGGRPVKDESDQSEKTVTDLETGRREESSESET